MFSRGTRVLTHCQMSFGIVRSALLVQKPKDLTWSDLIWPRGPSPGCECIGSGRPVGLGALFGERGGPGLEDVLVVGRWFQDVPNLRHLSLYIYTMVIMCYTMLYFIIIGDNNHIICFDMSWWYAHVMGNGPRARAPSTAPCCQDEALAEAVKENSLALLDGILLPNCSWRRPTVNLRDNMRWLWDLLG